VRSLLPACDVGCRCASGRAAAARHTAAAASIEYSLHLASGSAVNLAAEDAYHSRNPGPFDTDNPKSLHYAPGRGPNPSTNILNLRAGMSWSSLDLALFLNNVLDSSPTIQRRNICCNDTLFFATTFRPRTAGVTASWRF